MKILVIEDEIKTANYLRQGLSEAGYVVDVARDGLHLATSLIREQTTGVSGSIVGQSAPAVSMLAHNELLGDFGPRNLGNFGVV